MICAKRKKFTRCCIRGVRSKHIDHEDASARGELFPSDDKINALMHAIERERENSPKGSQLHDVYSRMSSQSRLSVRKRE